VGSNYGFRQAQEFNKLFVSGDSKAFYIQLRTAMSEQPGRVSGSPIIRNPEGELVTDLPQQKVVWRQYFDGLYNSGVGEGYDATLLDRECLAGEVMEQRVADMSLSAVPNFEEVKAAVRILGKEKATGADGVPKELWEVSNDCMYGLFCVVRDSWRSGVVPQSWKNAIITVLFKKGDRADCSNYRGISLLDHAGKVLAKIIAIRLSEYCERCGILLEEQCGFRTRRGTRDLMFVLRRLQEEAKLRGIALHWCFIDLAKAYDTVSREGLWIVLKRFGVPEHLVKVIRSLHDGMQARVRLDGELSEPFEVRQGLRQGCVMSPILFNMYFAALMVEVEKKFCVWREARAEVRSGVVELHYRFGVTVDPFITIANSAGLYDKKGIRELWRLLFADDAAFALLDAETLQALLNFFVEIASRFGLTVSSTKTKTMLQIGSDVHGEVSVLTLGPQGDALEAVKTFVYLGTVAAAEAGVLADLTRRKGLAMFAFKRCRSFFLNQDISFKARGAVFHSVVMSVLLYGAESWTVSAAQFAQLQSFHYVLLLWMRGKRRRDRVSYVSLVDTFHTYSIEGWIRYVRLLWIGVVMRMGDERLPKLVCRAGFLLETRLPGAHLSFFRCVADDLALFDFNLTPYLGPEAWWMIARDEGRWKEEVLTGWASYERRWRENCLAASRARHAAMVVE
jgi:hypothetical protein